MRETSAALGDAGIPDAAREALLLLELAAGRPREEWYREEPDLSPADVAALRALVERRRRREPFAYLRGWQEFWGMRLNVSPACLVPRPDTETLVEVALRVVPRRAGQVVDVGTGSGAVILALARSGPPSWRLMGVDRSPEALRVAAGNRSMLGLDARVSVRASDLLEAVECPLLGVVANLPYVGDGESVEPEVRWEPRSAVFAGPDGLALVARLIDQAVPKMEPGGVVALEVGAGQSEAVRRLMDAAGLRDGGVERDLAGLPRVVWGRCDGGGTGGPNHGRGVEGASP
jgi:release factor glutamine methyltransferase